MKFKAGDTVKLTQDLTNWHPNLTLGTIRKLKRDHKDVYIPVTEGGNSGFYIWAIACYFKLVNRKKLKVKLPGD